MRTKDLIQHLAGTKKIIVEGITRNAWTNEIIIAARATKQEQCRCGVCHRKATGYDADQGRRRWRCMDIGSAMVYIARPGSVVRSMASSLPQSPLGTPQSTLLQEL